MLAAIRRAGRHARRPDYFAGAMKASPDWLDATMIAQPGPQRSDGSVIAACAGV
ncbi:MAG: hypothetical protein JWR73_3298, partial [Tardiphaga sp.]|nr:hypothetical protein [Tardiphaga sp.]